MLARCRRPQVTCFLSYVQYRPTTNTAILWKSGHTKGKSKRRKLRKWILLLYSLYKQWWIQRNHHKKEIKVERRKIEEMNQIGLYYMEVPQGNFLCSYLKQPQMSFFSSFLIQNQWKGWCNRSCLGMLVPVGVGRRFGNSEGWWIQ
jgi:hypothetical protein